MIETAVEQELAQLIDEAVQEAVAEGVDQATAEAAIQAMLAVMAAGGSDAEIEAACSRNSRRRMLKKLYTSCN